MTGVAGVTRVIDDTGIRSLHGLVLIQELLMIQWLVDTGVDDTVVSGYRG
jgi:hypothetical protein